MRRRKNHTDNTDSNNPKVSTPTLKNGEAHNQISTREDFQRIVKYQLVLSIVFFYILIMGNPADKENFDKKPYFPFIAILPSLLQLLDISDFNYEILLSTFGFHFLISILNKEFLFKNSTPYFLVNAFLTTGQFLNFVDVKHNEKNISKNGMNEKTYKHTLRLLSDEAGTKHVYTQIAQSTFNLKFIMGFILLYFNTPITAFILFFDALINKFCFHDLLKQSSPFSTKDFLIAINRKLRHYNLSFEAFSREEFLQASASNKVILYYQPDYTPDNYLFKLILPYEGTRIDSTIQLTSDNLREAVSMTFSEIGLPIYHFEAQSKPTSAFIGALVDFISLKNLNESVIDKVFELLRKKIEQFSTREHSINQFKALEISPDEFSYSFNEAKQHWTFEVFLTREDSEKLRCDSIKKIKLAECFENFVMSEDCSRFFFTRVIQIPKQGLFNENPLQETIHNSNDDDDQHLIPIISSNRERMFHINNKKSSSALPKTIAAEARIPTSKTQSRCYTWPHLFNGNTVDLDEFPQQYLMQFGRNSSSSLATGPIVCWNEDFLRSEDAEIGDDIHKLKSTFDKGAPNGLKLLKEVLHKGQTYKIYELRQVVNCDKRVICILLSNPGEAPFLFATDIRNHTTLDNPFTPIIERALRKAPEFTKNLYDEFIDTKQNGPTT